MLYELIGSMCFMSTPRSIYISNFPISKLQNLWSVIWWYLLWCSTSFERLTNELFILENSSLYEQSYDEIFTISFSGYNLSFQCWVFACIFSFYRWFVYIFMGEDIRFYIAGNSCFNKNIFNIQQIVHLQKINVRKIDKNLGDIHINI